MVQIGFGTEREIEDIALTRYACYLAIRAGQPPPPFSLTTFSWDHPVFTASTSGNTIGDPQCAY